MPSCSVIIPCFNGERFIRDTIASLHAQTRPPDQIIVIDDGSTDDSATIVSSMSDVTLLRQTNQGESVARNHGLRAASAEYVVFLDADDLLAHESIERLGNAVATVPGAVAVMGTALFVDDPGVPFERVQPPPGTGFFPAILQTNFGPPHCWFIPRATATAVGGFREDLVHSEDWEFWGRVAFTGAPLVRVPYDGALYRRHPQSQVALAPKPAVFKGRLLVAETMAAQLLDRPDLLESAGDALFWSMWAMREQARQGGVPVAELQKADRLLRELARRGPAPLRRSFLARAVGWLGVPAAHRLRMLAGKLA